MEVTLLKDKTVYGVGMHKGDKLIVREEIGNKWIVNKEAELTKKKIGEKVKKSNENSISK